MRGMRFISLKLLLVVSTLSLTGGLIQSDNKQDNPHKKNSIAIVVEESTSPYKQDVSVLTEEVMQEKQKAHSKLKQIAKESQEKRQQSENLQKEKEQQEVIVVAQQAEMRPIANESTENQPNSPPSQSQPQAPQNQPQQVQSQSASTTETTRSAPAEPTYQAKSIYIGGVHIPYQNRGQASGQAIIDGNPHGTASTWGGAAVQSGSDGLSTHFIGHNPGIFASIFQLGIGSTVIVTDSDGTPHTYTVNQLYQVDDYAVELGTGRELWNLITGSSNGEQVVFQACINDHVNLIVIAIK